MNIFFPSSVLFFLCVEALAFQGAANENYLVHPAKLKSAPYPEWAHHHWYCSLIAFCTVQQIAKVLATSKLNGGNPQLIYHI